MSDFEGTGAIRTRRRPLNISSGAGVSGDILYCICNNKIIFPDGDEIILKVRLIKVADGITLAKCKRCGRWINIPLSLAVG